MYTPHSEIIFSVVNTEAITCVLYGITRYVGALWTNIELCM